MRWLVIAAVLLGAAQLKADDGKKLYTAKCARCHKFYDPSAYDDAKWNEWMLKMKNKAKLSDAQYARLTQYLTTLRTQK